MKFTDGFWQVRSGVTPLYAQEAYDLWERNGALVVTAPTRVIESRGDTLNRPVLTVTLTSPLPGIIGVRIEHFQGVARDGGFPLVGVEAGHGVIEIAEGGATLTSGDLTATI